MNQEQRHSRRTVLRHLALGRLAACPHCAGIGKALAGATEHGAGGPPHWSYEGAR